MLYREFILRIGMSLLLGLFIGMERQFTGHLAGVRINVLISMGSCLFVLFPMLYGSPEVFRMASYIITGVGFLCSGVIFKDQASVRGMNTAATLWCTAAVGMLASTGMFRFAVSAAFILIGSNLVLRPIANRIRPLAMSEEIEKQYRISVTCRDAVENEIRALLICQELPKSLYLNNLESSDINGERVEIYAEYRSCGKPKDHVLEGIVRRALENPAVLGAGWEVL